MAEKQFLSLNIAVLTVSDTRKDHDDQSGKLLTERLKEAGHNLAEKAMITDDIYQIRKILSRWIAEECVEVVITTGGTGLTGRDGTPEAMKPLLDKEIEGFGELFRSLSFSEIGTSTVQSRAIAGVANGTYLFSLPGSKGACRLAWEQILQDQLNLTNKPCNFSELIPRLLE